MKKLVALIFVILLVTGCSSTSSESLISDIEVQLTEELNVPVVIPKHEKYPVTSINLYYPSKEMGNDTMYVAHVIYSQSKGDLNELSKNEDYKKKWEEKNQAKILYGQYEGESAIKMLISNHSSNFSGSETKTLDGKEFTYEILNRPNGDVLNLGIDIESGGSYILFFHLNDKFTKNEAFEFVTHLLRKLQ
jgi:hypothetical protein